MSSLFLRTFSNPTTALDRTRALAEWRRMVARMPDDRTEVACTPHVVAGIAHHGHFRGSGIAHDPGGHRLLLIAGSYWLSDSDRHLATPADALRAITKNGFSDRQSLKGNYGFVLVDTAKRQVIAESDPFGIVPLYYAVTDGSIVVGTELKFFASAVHPRLNRDAVAEYLSIGYLVSDVSLLEGIRRLPPASRLTADRSDARVSPFPLSPFPRNEVPDNAFFDRLNHSFELAIGRHAADTNRYSLSLSGGVDSRTALLAARREELTVTSWSVGEPGSLECKVASDFCTRLGIPIKLHANQGDRITQWFDQAIWTTEARCPPGHFHFLDALFSGNYSAKPQIHGLIGDIVAGGDLDVDGPMPSGRAALDNFCRAAMQPNLYWPEGAWHTLGLARLGTREDIRERIADAILSRCPRDDAYSTYLWSRYQFRVFGFTVPCLVSQVAPWTDVVTPFIDPAFFDQCARIDTRFILDRRAQMQWAVRRYPSLSLVPRVKDGALIAFSATDPGDYQKRIGRLRRLREFRYLVCRLSSGRINLPHPETYPLYGAWFRKFPSVRRFFEQRLLSPESLDRGLWDRAGVVRLLHDLRVGRNVWNAAATLLQIETFARIFVDGSLSPPTPLPLPDREE